MNIRSIKDVHLGSGLIGIGRSWGHIVSPIPEEKDVTDFLSLAVKLGILYFDTAASYGSSEERLGIFLDTLSPAKRNKLIIATKFGDHWDPEKKEAYVDHSFEALKISLDTSVHSLKQIDLLYLHKAQMQVLQSKDVAKAFAYAKSLGIQCFGASVSDLASARYVVQNDFYSVIQLPYNMDNAIFADSIDEATKKGKIVVINRPFNMGNLLYEKNKGDEHQFKIEAYKFILKKQFNGFILTGTKSSEHLQENYHSFTHAKKLIDNEK